MKFLYCNFFLFSVVLRISEIHIVCWMLAKLLWPKSAAIITFSSLLYLLLSVGSGMLWGSMIPLIGGSSLGCFESAGNQPAFHLTYSAFKKYEGPLKKRWPNVPTYYLDEEEKGPEFMQGKSLNLSKVVAVCIRSFHFTVTNVWHHSVLNLPCI